MIGKITTVLVKKEAEAYRAQGLHKEAIALYDQLIDTCPNIDPELKTAIRNEAENISEEMHSFFAQRDKQLSADEIKRIKEGWGQQASQADIMVFAQSLIQVGAYEDALDEFRKLLEAGCKPQKLTGAMAGCLARAYSPQQLPQAVETLLTGLFSDSQKALVFQLRLAKSLAARKDKAHALAYYGHLQKKSGLPKRVAARMDQVVSHYQTLCTEASPAPQAAPPATQENQNTSKPKGLKRLLNSLHFKSSRNAEKNEDD
jgi:tetratricopeptide (TPR) repeat protein